MGLFDDLIPSGDGGPLRVTVTPRREVPAAGRALLDAIAGSESPGYDVMYGGGRFQDFADHPRQPVPITRGPNAGRTSSAAGRYQFLGSTWDEVKNEAGLPDFSPESQDLGAWHLATKTYKTKTGRDLERDLTSAKGNPHAVAGIGKMLSGVWTSLPGGIEPNNATMSFASRYDGAQQPPTDMSAQARRPAAGLFDDLIPVTASSAPETGPPASDAPLPDTGGRFTDAPGQSFRGAREGQSPTVATRGEAAKSGFFRGATFNFIDELKALAESGGVDPNDPDGLTAAIGLIKGAYRKATGDPEADAAYRAAASRERGESERMQEQQPGASILGEVGGALTAAPVAIGRVAQGAGLGNRVYQGAKAGAVFGGLAGAGEGTDLASRATGAGVGGLTGGALGAVAPVAVEGVVKAGQGIASAARPITTAIRGLANPEGEAARRIIQRIEADQRVGQGMRPAEFGAARAQGQPVTIMDMGGENTKNLARSAANTSGEAKAVLDKTINDRFEGQYGRISEWINKQFNYPNSYATEQAIDSAKKIINTPAYAKAYAAPGAQRMWDEGFEQMVQAPEVQAAIRKVLPQSASRAAMEGATPIRNPFVMDPASGRMVLRTLPDGSTATPNLQFWDKVKQQLDKGDHSSREWSRVLREHADGFVPEYKQARAGASILFDAENAHDAGRNFVTLNKNLNQSRADFAKFNPKEKQLFQDGFLSDFLESLGNVSDRRDILNKINKTPNARAKLEMVLGPKWPELEGRLRVEGLMDLARGAVQGNSTTARQIFELTAAGGVGGYGQLTGDPTAAGQALATWALLRGHRAIDTRVARRVGEMLASNNPQVLAKGLSIVTRNKGMMEALRSADGTLARMTAQQGPGVPALQSMGIGRAEDDQPRVPGP